MRVTKEFPLQHVMTPCLGLTASLPITRVWLRRLMSDVSELHHLDNAMRMHICPAHGVLLGWSSVTVFRRVKLFNFWFLKAKPKLVRPDLYLRSILAYYMHTFYPGWTLLKVLSDSTPDILIYQWCIIIFLCQSVIVM